MNVSTRRILCLLNAVTKGSEVVDEATCEHLHSKACASPPGGPGCSHLLPLCIGNDVADNTRHKGPNLCADVYASERRNVLDEDTAKVMIGLQ